MVISKDKTSDERALLCDFGLSRAISALTLTALKGARSARWSSPELWDEESKTLKSDVYAFGMTIYEILSGNVPYHHIKTDIALVRAIFENERPPRDPLIDPRNGASYVPIWEVAEECWWKEPSRRLDMADAFDRLRSAIGEEQHSSA